MVALCVSVHRSLPGCLTEGSCAFDQRPVQLPKLLLESSNDHMTSEKHLVIDLID